MNDHEMASYAHGVPLTRPRGTRRGIRLATGGAVSGGLYNGWLERLLRWFIEVTE